MFSAKYHVNVNIDQNLHVFSFPFFPHETQISIILSSESSLVPPDT